MADRSQPETIRKPVSYVYLDVVQFSTRSAEAQADIVNTINFLARQSLNYFEVKDDDCILIPTGDGMCIAFVGNSLLYDVHIQTALTILNNLFIYNKKLNDAQRKFQIRVGINENKDIIVNDINGRKNVAGAGINMAARIMDKADGNQILVGQRVFEELNPNEFYMGKFREPFIAFGKHNLKFNVYQYLGEDEGLNKEIPTEFIPKVAKQTELILDKTVAYYIAHCIKLQEFIVEHRDETSALNLILWFLAKDSIGVSEETLLMPYEPEVHGKGKLSLEESLAYYSKLDHNLRFEFAYHYIILKKLNPFYQCFERDDAYSSSYLLVADVGKAKLKKEFPEIWEDFFSQTIKQQTNGQLSEKVQMIYGEIAQTGEGFEATDAYIISKDIDNKEVSDNANKGIE